MVAQSTSLQVIVATGAKPSFLFWERVYTKVTEEQEAIWLVRALQQATVAFSSEIRKSEQLSYVSSSPLGSTINRYQVVAWSGTSVAHRGISASGRQTSCVFDSCQALGRRTADYLLRSPPCAYSVSVETAQTHCYF